MYDKLENKVRLEKFRVKITIRNLIKRDLTNSRGFNPARKKITKKLKVNCNMDRNLEVMFGEDVRECRSVQYVCLVVFYSLAWKDQILL